MSTILTYYKGDGEHVQPLTLKYCKYELVKPGVALIQFSRPRQMNTLNPPFVWELYACIEHAKRDDKVKALIWTGSGKAFSAGFDLSPSAKHSISAEVRKGYLNAGWLSVKKDPVLGCLTLQCFDFPKPFITACNGVAVGGGQNMATLCTDICVMSETTRMRLPFTDVALTPELSSSYFLPMRIGMGNAKKLMMLGEWLTAKDAYDLNLVQYIVPEAEVLPKAIEIAQKLANNPNQFCIAQGKALMHSHFRETLTKVLDDERKVILECMKHPDFMKSVQRIMAGIRKKKKKSAKL